MGSFARRLFSASVLVFLGLLSTQNFRRYHSLVIQDARFTAHSASYDSMCAGALGSPQVRVTKMYVVQGFIGCSTHADRFIGLDIVLGIMGRKMDFHYTITCRYNITKMADTRTGVAYDVITYNGHVINGTGLVMHGFAVPNVDIVHSLTNMCDTVDVVDEGMCYELHRAVTTVYAYFPFGVGLSLGMAGVHNVRCNLLRMPILDEIRIGAIIMDTPRRDPPITSYSRRITSAPTTTTQEPTQSYGWGGGKFRSPEAYAGCGTSDSLCTVGASG